MRPLVLGFVLPVLVLGACGADNTGERTEATATPTATPSGSPSATATPTTTPSPDDRPPSSACPGRQVLTTTIRPGADLDTGWTGISHDATATADSRVTIALDCDAASPTCRIEGAALVGTAFGPPLPLSSGGIPVCVLNEFREAVTGTYDCTTGCSEASVRLRSQIFLVQDLARPCPVCTGDAAPGDGARDGACAGGTADGAPCDVEGTSPDFGSTSSDCPPSGSSVGELAIDLAPLTTGALTVPAALDCASPFFPPGTCYCPDQIAANDCADAVCTDGLCLGSEPDGRCSVQRFRSCRVGTGDEDCDGVFRGAGICEEVPRPCFDTAIAREGTCGHEASVLVGFFCIPATRAPAINTTAGLPGPGALVLPVTTVRTSP